MTVIQVNIMLIEDEEFDARRVKNTLKLSKYDLRVLSSFSNGKKALEELTKNPDTYDVIIMDYQIAGGLMGEKLITEIKKVNPVVQILVITKMTIQQTNFDFADSLMKAGAFWFCTKYPADIEDIIYQPTDFILGIINAYTKKKLEVEKLRSDRKLDNNIQSTLEKKRIIGNSEAIEKLKSRIRKYSQTDANIMIYGESGTGKELIATNIHYLSKRKYDKFITLNCASIPNELIESELFGFEKGSFTGAGEKRAGYFEQADGGTLFLDEIGDFPLSAQAKLLRVLQEGEIDKIGRQKAHKVNVRVIAATNKDLKEMVQNGTFREDLYYRLNVLQINVEPLKEHLEDIPILIDHFIAQFSTKMGSLPPFIKPSTMEKLMNYKWHGNVRELQNVVQRMLLIADEKIDDGILEEALTASVSRKIENKKVFNFNEHAILSLRDMEKELRREYITFVKKMCKTDTEVAAKLGLAPSNLYRTCKELGLK
ncbi:MAG: sigma-54-dependent Fis family transcriptional regulator [Candidatus Marinimicrobia bacterium]|nr:sigma-54-dependent Fis family transcriptional regulator [Candidatus Neomarinimicrobiota bacterium]